MLELIQYAAPPIVGLLGLSLFVYLITRDYPVWRLGLFMIGAALWLVVTAITAENWGAFSPALRYGIATLLSVILAGIYLLAVRLKLSESAK